MNKLASFLLAALCATLLGACDWWGNDQSMIYDYSPIVLEVQLLDKDGKNVLDPGLKGNALKETVTITRNGVDYDVKGMTPSAKPLGSTRALAAQWYGGVLKTYPNFPFSNCIYIGEWDAFTEKDEITIHVRNADHKISFTNSYNRNKKEPYKFRHTYYLDGVETKFPIKITVGDPTAKPDTVTPAQQ